MKIVSAPKYHALVLQVHGHFLTAIFNHGNPLNRTRRSYDIGRESRVEGDK
jgi:hypothetical protein